MANRQSAATVAPRIAGPIGKHEKVAQAIWARIGSETKWALLALGMREFGEVRLSSLASVVARAKTLGGPIAPPTTSKP